MLLNGWSLANLRPSMALSLGISWQFNMPKPGGGPLSWRLLKMFQISDGLWENILIGWDLSSEETVQELRFKKLATWSITEWIAKLPDTENSSRSSNSLDGSLKLPNPPFRNPLPSGLGRKILLAGNSPCHIQPRQQACCLCCKHLTSRNPCCWNFSGKGIPGRRNVSKEAAMCEMLQEICHLIYHMVQFDESHLLRQGWPPVLSMKSRKGDHLQRNPSNQSGAIQRWYKQVLRIGQNRRTKALSESTSFPNGQHSRLAKGHCGLLGKFHETRLYLAWHCQTMWSRLASLWPQSGHLGWAFSQAIRFWREVALAAPLLRHWTKKSKGDIKPPLIITRASIT